jgi:hypothetical protein
MMNAIYSDSNTYLKSIYRINHNHATWMQLDGELSQGTVHSSAMLVRRFLFPTGEHLTRSTGRNMYKWMVSSVYPYMWFIPDNSLFPSLIVFPNISINVISSKKHNLLDHLNLALLCWSDYESQFPKNYQLTLVLYVHNGSWLIMCA